MTRRKIGIAAALFGIPLLIVLGIFLFKDRRYDIITAAAALLACVMFFTSFEKRRPNAKEIVLVAAMVAISVAGRFAFAFIPAFKPITAIVVICGIYFGESAGFLTGALSALVSNIYFGQGPWTPFQMLTWGLIGFFAGICAGKKLFRSRIFLIIYGALAGAMYSLVMDLWTTMSVSGDFQWERYLAAVAAALPFMLIYAVSNVIFLLLLEKPLGKKLSRITKKFGLFKNSEPQ